MKKNFTIKRLAFTLLTGFLFLGLSAQVTINVPADFPTLDAAIKSIKTNASVTNDAEVIINITESIAEVNTVSNYWDLGYTGLKVTVQGQGPSTIIGSALGRRPSFTTDEGTRIAQMGSGSTILDGLHLTFKNLTFQNWGRAFTGEANGGIFNFNSVASNPWSGKVSFQNVVVDSCVGRTIIKTFAPAGHDVEFEFDNCLFTNNVVTVKDAGAGEPLAGIINKESGGKITVKNCTFFDNMFVDYEGKSRQNGSIITVNVYLQANTDVIIEGTQMLNNYYTEGSPTVVQSLVTMKPIGAETGTLLFKDNLVIGNARAAATNDIGFLLTKSNQITVSTESTGNIMNTAKHTVDGLTYDDLVFPESQINAAFVYNSPEVNLVMEGDLPKLTADEFGILHASMVSTALNKELSIKAEVYPNPSKGIFEINLSQVEAVNYTIYNLVGKVLKSGIVNNGHKYINLNAEKSGVYIMKLYSNDGLSSTHRLVVE